MKYCEPSRNLQKWLNFNSPVELVAGVEKEDIKDLNKLGIYNVWDLISYYPDIKIDFENPIHSEYSYVKYEYDVKGLFSNGIFQSVIKNILMGLPTIKDFLPDSIRLKYRLLPLDKALKNIHSSPLIPYGEFEPAVRRLAFNELFLIQCGLRLAKRQATFGKKGIAFGRNGEIFQKIFESLPFNLTSAQAKVLEDITNDMENPTPMRRLVQGDVGSGKTVVAMLALVKAVENGYQGAMLAPTEILAIQHYNNFKESLEKIGIRVGLLSAKVTRSKKARTEIYQKIANHEFDIVVGTHAMLENDVKFAKLGLAITDEQHRFGVMQRAKLSEKSDVTPDVLAMTATPIPRTITLTFYGDLEVSRIEQMPAGRKPVETVVKTKRNRRSAYTLVRKEILKGRQAYIVCPLRSWSKSSNAESADIIYEVLTEGALKDIPGALIHGKMKAAEKDAIMERFKNGEIKYIVSTTVIEVGVNVPNATVMVIEDADRFGLAQLHQLRGRVGRGSFQSYCFLISSSKDEVAQERLGLMEKTTNGFELAEADLKMRGPGQFFGEKQFGMPDLKLASIFEDMQIFWDAYKAAEDFMNCGEFDSYVDEVKRHIKLAFKNKFEQINNI